jgi:hypothetical protein
MTCGKQRAARRRRMVSAAERHLADRMDGVRPGESYPRAAPIPHFDERQLELWVAGEGACRAEFCGRRTRSRAGKPAVLDVPGSCTPGARRILTSTICA